LHRKHGRGGYALLLPTWKNLALLTRRKRPLLPLKIRRLRTTTTNLEKAYIVVDVDSKGEVKNLKKGGFIVIISNLEKEACVVIALNLKEL